MKNNVNLVLVLFYLLFTFQSRATEVATLVFDLNECVEGEELDDYTEFTAEINNTNEIQLEVVNDNLFRDNPSINQHSCAPSFDGTAAMCVSYDDSSCIFNANDDTAVRFGVVVTPTNNQAVTLSSLRFFDLAPTEFIWIGGGSGINNPPTLMSVRVLVDDQVIFLREDIAISDEWTLNEFDFEGIEGFTITQSTVFDFELTAYCSAGVDATQSIWDLENISLSAFCANTDQMDMDTMTMVVDTDLDGFADADDNCPSISNVEQLDFDGDGMGDVCDSDDDNDGILDMVDCDPFDGSIAFSVGDACDDGNPATMNDIVNANCVCQGTAPADADGDGVADPDDNCPMVSNADQSDNDGNGLGDVCDDDVDGDGVADEIDCDPLDTSIAFSIGDTCNDGNPNTAMDTITMSCMCIGTLIDTDGDGVTDGEDNCPSIANTDQVDFDGDGIGDICDSDDDNDGVLDMADCDPFDGSNAFSIGDACDDGNAMTLNDMVNVNCVCQGEAPADIDGDGIPDADDNCPSTANTDQLDLDGDGIGDICDDDDDNDGVADEVDCDPLNASIALSIGDACDDGDFNTEMDTINMSCICIGTLIDTDGDGMTDADDNCPSVSNSDQADFDGDGMGDVCDADVDGDGVADEIDCDPLDTSIAFSIGDACDDGNPNTAMDTITMSCMCIGTLIDTDDDGIPDSDDNCPSTPNPDQADFDGDGLGDVCDEDDDNDGELDTTDCDPLNDNLDFSPGVECNDGDPNTENDTVDSACNCVGTPVQTGPTIWTCPEITFTKESNTDFSDPANQDFFTDNVIITRDANGGQIINFANNDDPDDFRNVPSGVEWAIGRTAQLPNLNFGGFREIIGRPRENIVGLELVMHLIEDDIFLNITFSSWGIGDGDRAGGNGGFSYSRSTPGDCEGSPRSPQQNSLNFVVAPTISRGSILLSADDLDADMESVHIYNQSGLIVKQIEHVSNQSGAMNIHVDISNLDPGMYFIRAISNTGELSIRRFIKTN